MRAAQLWPWDKAATACLSPITNAIIIVNIIILVIILVVCVHNGTLVIVIRWTVKKLSMLAHYLYNLSCFENPDISRSWPAYLKRVMDKSPIYQPSDFRSPLIVHSLSTHFHNKRLILTSGRHLSVWPSTHASDWLSPLHHHHHKNNHLTMIVIISVTQSMVSRLTSFTLSGHHLSVWPFHICSIFSPFLYFYFWLSFVWLVGSHSLDSYFPLSGLHLSVWPSHVQLFI